jgi:cell division protein FtsI/penicillin-binding protein 2
LVIIFGVIVIVARLFNLQVINRKTYTVLASDQHEIFQKLFPARGRIFVKEKDINGKEKNFPLATNKEYALVYAQPNLIEKPEEVAEKIYPILFREEIKQEEKQETRNKKQDIGDDEHTPSLSQEGKRQNDGDDGNEDEDIDTENDYIYAEHENYKILLNKLKKEDDPYEPLKRKVDLEILAEINKLKLDGINSVRELWRYYPDHQTESHILGFVRHEQEKNIGQYGLEGYYNNILAGQQGHIQTESGAKGNLITLGEIDIVEARNGSDIFLTIDRTIQFKIYEELQKAVKDYEIEGGSIIVMQPKTGAILAMASYPDFDPNNYNQVASIDVFNNPATLHTYEPGSIFKAITMAIALDLDKVSPDTKYYDEGVVMIEGFPIRNVDGKSYKWQTMTEVLEKSLNTGAIFVAKKVGNEEFLNYVKKFGFGEKTGIELAGEGVGNIKQLEKLHDVYTFTASFGQGITVTPIQMITAFAAIANDGKLVKPYLVDEIIDYEGNSVKTIPQQVRQVISPRAATLIKAMLVSVINNGHAKRAGVKGYHLAGKTGTAQISDPGGGYSKDKFNHSFVGFGPVDDPQFVIMVKLNNPQGVRFSSESAAPIFGRLAEFILKYYEIAPTRE